ncbi:MAG: hypothetical protein EOS55_29695 [Mesorhizobium sp.]|nr:MAG: hypothetical protein EOS55_29695 [Mesorhizobium sp.]
MAFRRLPIIGIRSPCGLCDPEQRAPAFQDPRGVAVDKSGALLIADDVGNTVCA